MSIETDYSSQKLRELRAAEVKAQMLLDKFIEDSSLITTDKFRLRRMVNDLVIAACKNTLASNK